MIEAPNPHLVLPVGTKVVSRVEVQANATRPLCRKGSLGVVVRSPHDRSYSYRVRFLDGSEASYRREELALLSQVQTEGMVEVAAMLGDFDLEGCVIYRCVVGSRAYGLEHDASDTDRRGIYLPPARLHWSLYGVPEQLEDNDAQECYWELQKFLHLALKANPNILECLWTPLLEHADEIAQELLAGRARLLSKLVYHTYNGYVLGQFKKLDQRLQQDQAIKPKHAMHLIRLLLAGVQVLRSGELMVQVDRERERLLAIRDGAMDWSAVNTWRLELHKDFEQAFLGSELPERPDYSWANDLLVRARRLKVEEE